MKEDLFRDIIMKFLEGDATAHERRMLANWLKEDPAREEIFYYHLSMREQENPQHLPEVNSRADVYERFLRGEIEMPPLDVQLYRQDTLSGLRSGNYRWLLAASIVLFLSAGFYFLHDSLRYKTYIAEKGTVRSFTLDDGSTVTLNANSSIKVLRDFMGHESREVWIDGEAFFEVARKEDHMKFVVHANNFDVEVLGTKFNVNDRRGKSEVTLAEGKVKLVAKDKPPLIMQPGEQVVLSRLHDRFEKQVVNPEKYQAWRSSKLVFENTPLAEVAEIVQDYYGVQLVFVDSLLARREFTGTLPNDDLEVILMAISISYNIEIKKRGDEILLQNINQN